MLLLVMEADLEYAHHLRQRRLLGTGEQPRDPVIDMRAERCDLLAVRPRQEPAPGPRVARSGRHVIRVEEIGELLVEDPIAGEMRDQQELLEKPGGMRAVPFGRTGIGHRLHDLVLGTKRRGAAFGLRAHGAEGLAPDGPRIVRRSVSNCCGITFVAAATKDG